MPRFSYVELEQRYGEILAQQFLLKEFEKAAGIRANDNDLDYEGRLTQAQRAQDNNLSTPA